MKPSSSSQETQNWANISHSKIERASERRILICRKEFIGTTSKYSLSKIESASERRILLCRIDSLSSQRRTLLCQREFIITKSKTCNSKFKSPPVLVPLAPAPHTPYPAPIFWSFLEFRQSYFRLNERFPNNRTKKIQRKKKLMKTKTNKEMRDFILKKNKRLFRNMHKKVYY
jgi:hypothetical protein